MHRKID